MAIKSYLGESAGKKAPKAEEIHVEHYMNKAVVSFKTTQDILEIMDALVKNRISGGPIVSESNEVVGFISEGDCIRQITESKYYNLPLEEMNIDHYMTKNVICVAPDESLLDIAKKFLTTKKKKFPGCMRRKINWFD